MYVDFGSTFATAGVTKNTHTHLYLLQLCLKIKKDEQTSLEIIFFF